MSGREPIKFDFGYEESDTCKGIGYLKKNGFKTKFTKLENVKYVFDCMVKYMENSGEFSDELLSLIKSNKGKIITLNLTEKQASVINRAYFSVCWTA